MMSPSFPGFMPNGVRRDASFASMRRASMPRGAKQTISAMPPLNSRNLRLSRARKNASPPSVSG